MHRTAFAFIALSAAVAILSGCAGNGEGLDENGRPIDGGPVPLAANFESIQQNVFTPVCTTCHAGANPPVGLRLDAASSYAMLVNVPSVEVPGLRRVQPGNPDASYLVQKIEGSAAVGGRMPLNRPPLSQEAIDAIRQWIAVGAPRTVGGTPSTKPAVLTAITPLDDAILDAPPNEIVIAADGELDVNRIDRGTVELLRSGFDGSFAEGNEVAVNPLHFEIRSTDPTVIAITVPFARWERDSYRLTVAGDGPATVTDRGSRLIDGDADGIPGGNFIAHFELGNSQQ